MKPLKQIPSKIISTLIIVGIPAVITIALFYACIRACYTTPEGVLAPRITSGALVTLIILFIMADILLMLLVAFCVLPILDRIFCTNLADSSNGYTNSYANAYRLTNDPFITTEYLAQYAGKTTGTLYTQISYAELECTFNRMQKLFGQKNSALCMITWFNSNQSFTPYVAYRTAQRLLTEMYEGKYQYVILRYNFNTSHVWDGERREEYLISLKDIRRIREKLGSRSFVVVAAGDGSEVELSKSILNHYAETLKYTPIGKDIYIPMAFTK